MVLFGHSAGYQSDPGLCSARWLLCQEDPAAGLRTASQLFSPGSTGGAGRLRRVGDPQAQPKPSSWPDLCHGGIWRRFSGVSPHCGRPYLGPQGCWGRWGLTGSAAGGTDGTGLRTDGPGPRQAAAGQRGRVTPDELGWSLGTRSAGPGRAVVAQSGGQAPLAKGRARGGGGEHRPGEAVPGGGEHRAGGDTGRGGGTCRGWGV